MFLAVVVEIRKSEYTNSQQQQPGDATTKWQMPRCRPRRPKATSYHNSPTQKPIGGSGGNRGSRMYEPYSTSVAFDNVLWPPNTASGQSAASCSLSGRAILPLVAFSRQPVGVPFPHRDVALLCDALKQPLGRSLRHDSRARPSFAALRMGAHDT